MKFAQQLKANDRYLRDTQEKNLNQYTQTPEWKKAYIDYRGLKKRITVIRKSQQGVNFHVLPSDDSPDEEPSPPAAPRASDVDSEDYERSIESERVSLEDHAKSRKVTDHVGLSVNDTSDEGKHVNTVADGQPVSPVSVYAVSTGNRTRSTSAKGRPPVNLSSFKDTGAREGKSISSRFNGLTPRHLDPLSILPLHELLNHLSPQEVSFFILLDAQLDKVESFYLAREQEMLTRGHMLKIQLDELQDHRKLFHEAQLQIPWTANFITTAKSVISLRRPTSKPSPAQIEPSQVRSRRPKMVFRFKSKTSEAQQQSPEGLVETIEEQGAVGKRDSQTSSGRASSSSVSKTQNLKSLGKCREREAGYSNNDLCDNSTQHVLEDPEQSPSSAKKNHENKNENSDVADGEEHGDSGPRQVPLSADPDSYLYAKRKLKKAVLNITGFRKALKKFEKVTKIPVQHQYMTEKVEKSAFASDKAVAQMMAEMEDMYAAAFVRGNKKMATKRLRAGNSSKSHHFSTFRSGAYIGIALPALIEGLVKDFWMGLIFTLSNFYFFACIYVDDFHPDWKKCSVTPSTWPVYFILAALPLFIRLVQSIKRYWDSKLITHLINGGKYGSGIFAYFFYFLWRRHQNERGTIFAFWCLTNIIYSVYASTWDFLMDWSVLQIHSTHPLLRSEIIYTNHMPISNILIRFIWIIYIPQSGPNMMVRTFIAGFLEMLRRWQWNFYRLENEHLGNMDQYRVTREVPLPYAINDQNREYDGDDDDHLKVRRR
ncbi:hypothetical protein CVT25_006840 [Psilocybe cyanescens]|uniref:EXS domain-containing protein n=1 Tax=Psilocybe cyanescens TaxID=93625 RepID=A0A409X7B9_PSICY|nr:hypothetical protein CVT25_006840 [Psilocybe cyanescens]